MQNCFAKYVMNAQREISVYIDKTPPIINVTSNNDKESFPTSTTDIIKKVNDVIIDTSDNVKIDHNEIYYNPTENNFENNIQTNFDMKKN